LQAQQAQDKQAEGLSEAEVKSHWQTAADTLKIAGRECAGSSEEWEVYRVLAICYAQLGERDKAIDAGNHAFALAPADQRAAIREFLDQIREE